ncbi:hypothetical protein HMPREF9336_03377 [Segniliparus rugosus ATCC BAA-974]|uniref:Uncharacterized protein n=1 Tax=Segniliparus rugosus (strain ATCC BAA-974 / DSM 45345 / CCUG 50838 / CIP 108380 / JCM 13579 / CDC 945) TaxID=679197 RepID=E5XV55_SEGRC|nr:hypothetical protein HMPREF9336_03377 [Segniliparus rugosus ATCC BAA-974]
MALFGALASAAATVCSAQAEPLDPARAVMTIRFEPSPYDALESHAAGYAFVMRKGSVRYVRYAYGGGVVGDQTKPLDESSWRDLLRAAGQDTSDAHPVCPDFGFFDIKVEQDGTVAAKHRSMCPGTWSAVADSLRGQFS